MKVSARSPWLLIYGIKEGKMFQAKSIGKTFKNIVVENFLNLKKDAHPGTGGL
jgi:hypothetical protein